MAINCQLIKKKYIELELNDINNMNNINKKIEDYIKGNIMIN